MKFLLELVSCCGPSGSCVNNKEAQEVLETVSGGKCSEETRALVVTWRSRSRKKRGRGGNAGSSSADWKPTLRAISEDDVVVTAARERVVKIRKGSSSGRRSGDCGGASRNIASLSSYNDDYRRNQFTSVIPAFSPAPFMI